MWPRKDTLPAGRRLEHLAKAKISGTGGGAQLLGRAAAALLLAQGGRELPPTLCSPPKGLHTLSWSEVKHHFPNVRECQCAQN